MDRVAQVLLAIRAHDRWLTTAQGGPVRLVVPWGACFSMQIKWLNRLALPAESAFNAASQILSAGSLPDAPPAMKSSLAAERKVDILQPPAATWFLTRLRTLQPTVS